MVQLNKYENSSLRINYLARAFLGVAKDYQNIPSELYALWIAVCGLIRPDGTNQQRYPWHIVQPGTPEQRAVWDIFLRSVVCFAKQPDAGGVTPPDIGPRNRSWWFDNDPGVPPIYYNYFLRETLNKYHALEIPDWDFDKKVDIWLPAFHLGDEVIPTWPVPNPEGTEKSMNFNLTEIPTESLIQLDVWEVNYNDPVYINNNFIGNVPAHASASWLDYQRIVVPDQGFYNIGANTLKIVCEYRDPPGTWEDMMIRNIKLKYLIYP